MVLPEYFSLLVAQFPVDVVAQNVLRNDVRLSIALVDNCKVYTLRCASHEFLYSV